MAAFECVYVCLFVHICSISFFFFCFRRHFLFAVGICHASRSAYMVCATEIATMTPEIYLILYDVTRSTTQETVDDIT